MMIIVIIIELDVYTPASTRGECRTGHILPSKCFVDKRDWEPSKKRNTPYMKENLATDLVEIGAHWNLLNWVQLVEAREARCQTVLDEVCITHLFTCRLRQDEKK